MEIFKTNESNIKGNIGIFAHLIKQDFKASLYNTPKKLINLINNEFETNFTIKDYEDFNSYYQKKSILLNKIDKLINK